MPAPFPPTLQTLPPAQARFCLKVLRFVERELKLDLTGQRVLVGFSGGADSTALLLALHCLAPKLRLTLTAAHLDHGLRASSADEAQWCHVFCRKLGIPCITASCDVPHLQQQEKLGIEEAARKARYDFYATVLEQSQSSWLALGHHANDLAEDVLMRLIRGTGWPALGGMSAVDEQRKLLRPLLLTPRAEVEEFLTALSIDWLTDESNADPAFLRNRVRKSLLPLFLQENPAFLETIAGLWRLGQIDAGFFSTQLPDLSSALPSFILPAAQLLPLHKALRLRLYKKILAALGPGQAQLSSLLALDTAWLNNPERTEHWFPGEKVAVVCRKDISWERRQGKKRASGGLGGDPLRTP